MENNWILLLVSAVFAVIAILGRLWQSRARAASRLEAVLDAYAAREIAWVARRKKTQNRQRFAANGDVLQSHRANRAFQPQ